MAFVLNDRVKETTTTTGTGTVNLGGAATGFETFVAGVGNSNSTYYCIAGQTTAEFEVGIGTVTDASPDTLSRTTILSSSNSDSAVDFSAGTKDVFCTLPAAKTIREFDTAVNIPTGTTAQRSSSAAAGDFRYNTSTGRFEGYSSAWNALGGSNTFSTDIFAGDGSDTTFTLSQSIENENDLFVFIDGVFQAHNSYSVSGTTLTFSTAPADGRVITAYSVKSAVSGNNVTISTMDGDGSDTTLTLAADPVNENNVQVYIDGVYQNKDTFAVSGTTLTFSAAPPNGTKVEAITLTQTNINTATQLADADGDTKVQVEESSDEDTIRMDIAGTEVLTLTNSAMTLKGTTPTLTIGDAGAEDTKIVFDGNAQDYYIGLDDSADDLIIGLGSTVGTTPIMSFDENKDVTINEGKLTTSGANGADNQGINITDTGYSKTHKIYGDNSLHIQADSGQQILFKPNATEAARFDASGNLGIGTTSPSHKLEVVIADTSSTPEILIGNGDSSARSALIRNQNDASEFDIIASASSSANKAMRFFTADGSSYERMRIDADGNVGIGTTPASASSTTRMHIHNGTSTAILQLTGAGVGTTASDGAELAADDNGDFRIRNFESGSMQFYNNGSERMRIDASGNVGIGASPNANFRNDGAATEKFFQVGSAAVLFADSGITTALANNCAINNSDARIALSGTNPGSMYEQYQGIHVFYTTDSVAAGSAQTMTARFRISQNGDLAGTDTSISSISDERIKKNIADYSDGLNLIKNLKPRTFEFKDKTGIRKTGTQRGFIAQEVLEHDTYWISEEDATDIKDGEYEYTKDTEKRYLSKLNDKDAMYVSAIQEQQELIETLQAKVEALENG